MKEFIAKCGCNCGKCPSFKGNLKTIEDRNKILDEYKARVEIEDPEMAPDILDDICYYHGLQNLILWHVRMAFLLF